MITQLILGGIIWHTTPQPAQIDRTQFQVNTIMKFEEVNVLLGHNSISQPIFGLGYDYKLSESWDFKLGAYYQDHDKFERLGVRHVTGDIVPIVGFEHNYVITPGVNLTNIITPLITFHGFSLTF